MSNKLQKEINSYKKLWKNGTTLSKYGWEKTAKERLKVGTNLNKINELCICPYVTDKVCLDIGTNGGGWIKKMLDYNPSKVIGIDVSSPEHTGFWKNIIKKENILYYQLKDFNLDFLDNNSIDYVFSYDVFCHISFSGTEQYLKNLYPKLKSGSDLFIMIADADKYKDQNGLKKLMSQTKFKNLNDFFNDYDGDVYNGRWYFYGTDRFINLLKKYNYTLVDSDIIKEHDKNSPIIHFKKI